VARTGKEDSGLKGYPLLIYGTALVGSVLFLGACFAHSKPLGFIGIGLIVVSVLLGLPVLMKQTNKASRHLDALAAVWAVLFAVWLIVAVLQPFARQFAVPVGLTFVAGFFTLAGAFWRRERKAS
jgi:hypothetical protein